MSAHFRIAAITDEFSPDIEIAARSMADIGMTGAELRMVFGKNILDLTDEELDRAIAIVRGSGLEIISISSPLLKCVLPDAPEVDARFQKDMFASKHTFDDQPRLAARAFEIAEPHRRAHRPRLLVLADGAAGGVLRPDRDARCAAWRNRPPPHGITIGLENEHACNVATAAETARVLAALDHPNLKVVWDPANALVAGENPFPGGIRQTAAAAHRARARERLLRAGPHAHLGPARRVRDRLERADRRARPRRLSRAGSAWRRTGPVPAATSTKPA